MKRREFLATGAAVAGASAISASAMSQKTNRAFPKDFMWGVSTAGHQIEGNNTASDLWFLENLPDSLFKDPSGDACNSFILWEKDLQMIKELGLNTYRFSIEWARIEPTKGVFSKAMLAYYKQRIDRCAEMGIKPVVTFNHFVSPLWFSAENGWMNPESPNYFTRYCKVAMEYLGENIAYAVTLNEPNIVPLLTWMGLPQFVLDKKKKTLAMAAEKLQVPKFSATNVMNNGDIEKALPNLLAAHRGAFDTIKSIRPDLPVGVSIAITDDQAVGENSIIEEKRQLIYGPWLETAKQDDFLGIQNYERARVGPEGDLPPPKDAIKGIGGAEVYPPSLAGAVKYAYEVVNKPIFVTEHGVAAEDDSIRSWFIPSSLHELHKVMEEGVPVIGYSHWTLMDNFEWVFGYGPKLGLFTVDRETFERTAKPSAAVYSSIVRKNAV